MAGEGKVVVTDAIIISDNAFSIINCDIKTLILNEGIESIGRSAFSRTGNGFNFGIEKVVIQKNVQSFEECPFVYDKTSVFYCGDINQWKKIYPSWWYQINRTYFYSETFIDDKNNYWYYVNDEITIWE